MNELIELKQEEIVSVSGGYCIDTESLKMYVFLGGMVVFAITLNCIQKFKVYMRRRNINRYIEQYAHIYQAGAMLEEAFDVE